jgi:hypothetical protein
MSARVKVNNALQLGQLSIQGPNAWVAKSMLAVLSGMFVLTTLYAPLFDLCAMKPSTVLTGPYSHVWTLVTAGWV